MAEFLILRKDHWATTKPESWTQDKFDGRQMAGDVVEAREDGFFRIEYLKEGKVGWNRDTFSVIRVKTVAKTTADSKTGAYVTSTVTRKFRHHVPDWAKLNWNKNKVEINKTVYEEWYLDAASIVDVGIVDKSVAIEAIK